jgi:hypothetical protein
LRITGDTTGGGEELADGVELVEGERLTVGDLIPEGDGIGVFDCVTDELGDRLGDPETLADLVALTDGLIDTALREGLAVGMGVVEGVSERDGVIVGDGDPDTDTDGEADCDGALVGDIDMDGDCDGVTDRDGVLVGEGLNDAWEADEEGVWLFEGVPVAVEAAPLKEGVPEALANADGDSDAATNVDVEGVTPDGEGVGVVVMVLADGEEDTDTEGVVDGVGVVDTRLGEGELERDADAVTVGVTLDDTMVADGDPLPDKEGVTDRDGLELTVVADGVIDGEVDATATTETVGLGVTWLPAGVLVAVADRVTLADVMLLAADGVAVTVLLLMVVVEGAADRGGVAYEVVLADGELDGDGVGVIVMVLADGETVGIEDTLTDGVALMDTMLGETTVGDRGIDGVLDGVGEADTRLDEGELVREADALTDGVPLNVAMVIDGEALDNSDGTGEADNALAVDKAALLLLGEVEGVAGCGGVTYGVTLEDGLVLVADGDGLADTLVPDGEAVALGDAWTDALPVAVGLDVVKGVVDSDGLADATVFDAEADGDRDIEGLALTMVAEADPLGDTGFVTEVAGLPDTRLAEGVLDGEVDPMTVEVADGELVAVGDGEIVTDTMLLAADGEADGGAGDRVLDGDGLADTMVPAGEAVVLVVGVTGAGGLELTTVRDGEALRDGAGVPDTDGLVLTTVPEGETMALPDADVEGVGLEVTLVTEAEPVGVIEADDGPADTVVAADGVDVTVLLLMVVVEGVADREGVAYALGLTDGELEGDGVGDVVMVLAEGETVGKEDTLTDGVALSDTMLGDTVGDRNIEGVVDGVGEADT